jgi:hypothetical protein
MVGGYSGNYGPSVRETEEISLLDQVMRQVLAARVAKPHAEYVDACRHFP